MKITREAVSTALGVRSRDARYYKPLCVFVVCDLIEKGIVDVEKIKFSSVNEAFNEIIAPLNLPGIGKAFEPFWHLSTPGFWACYSYDSVVVKHDAFSSGRPKTQKQLEKEVDHAVPSLTAREWFATKENRAQLMLLLTDLLIASDDKESKKIGEYLRKSNSISAVPADDPQIYSSQHEGNKSEGIELDAVPENYIDGEWLPERLSIEDYSKFRVHKAYDRRHSEEVKKLHGYRCELCRLDMVEIYGEVGKGYIEAHHLKPISELHGQIVSVDLKKDFIVLCANCHRMIHRAKLPHSIDAYVEAHGKPKVRV